jgi:hypothetical protein
MTTQQQQQQQLQQPIYDIGTLVWDNIRTHQAREERKKIKRVGGSWIRVWNNHPKFTDEEIWKVVRHVACKFRFNQHYAIEVRVEVMSEPGGCGCHGKVYLRNMDDPEIVAWISDDDQSFPTWCYYPTGWGYLSKLLLDRTEALVMILGHEFRHLWQTDIPDEHNLPERKARSHWRKFKRRGYVWGARGVLSNRDADAYAIHKVREYRRLQQQYNYCT